jgi:hypothetical protein
MTVVEFLRMTVEPINRAMAQFALKLSPPVPWVECAASAWHEPERFNDLIKKTVLPVCSKHFAVWFDEFKRNNLPQG